MHIEIPSIKYQDLNTPNNGEASKDIKARVEKAQRIQRERFKGEGILYNVQMNNRLLKRHCALSAQAGELLRLAMSELGLSARAHDKILKISRTIADLAGSAEINAEHISEAIQYRSLDRQLF